MSVVKVVELVGTSKEGWQDAANVAIKEAAGSLRHITGIDVVNQTAQVENGQITEYRTTINVAFVIEHHSQLVGATR
jgi:flavin-binding protein dodecin